MAHRHRAGRSPETARDHMLTAVPRARTEETAAAALARFRTERFDYGETVVVLDADGRLAGALGLAEVVAAPPEAAMGSLVVKPPAHVRPETDQEHVAHVALRGRTTTVPVVDEAGRFLGLVPPVTLLAVLHREHVEDVHVLAGIRREAAHVRHALEDPPARRARDRLPWLLLGLAGSALTAVIMARFHATLEARVAVAFFVPGIVYLADAIGTQTEAIVVRGLSATELSFKQLALGELRTGLLIGLVLAALAWVGVFAAFGEVRLATAVAVAVVVAGASATSIGLLLPWTLARLGKDPAFGSGPVATVIQDVLSILVYFAAATALL